jgi:hypothetical protein
MALATLPTPSSELNVVILTLQDIVRRLDNIEERMPQ